MARSLTGSGSGAEARRGLAARAPGVTAFVDAAEVLRALSHPVRLRMVAILSGGELCVKRLEEVLGVPQPSVSQHLSRLRHAGLIESERRGHLMCYRLASGKAAAVLSAALGRGERGKGV